MKKIFEVLFPKNTVQALVLLLILVCIIVTFTIGVRANNDNKDFEITITSAETPKITRSSVPSTQFEKNIGLVLKVKIPSLNFKTGGCSTEKIFELKDASIPINIPLVITVNNDLSAISVYAKTINISFQWDATQLKIKEIK